MHIIKDFVQNFLKEGMMKYSSRLEQEILKAAQVVYVYGGVIVGNPVDVQKLISYKLKPTKEEKILPLLKKNLSQPSGISRTNFQISNIFSKYFILDYDYLDLSEEQKIKVKENFGEILAVHFIISESYLMPEGFLDGEINPITMILFLREDVSIKEVQKTIQHELSHFTQYAYRIITSSRFAGSVSKSDTLKRLVSLYQQFENLKSEEEKLEFVKQNGIELKYLRGVHTKDNKALLSFDSSMKQLGFSRNLFLYFLKDVEFYTLLGDVLADLKEVVSENFNININDLIRNITSEEKFLSILFYSDKTKWRKAMKLLWSELEKFKQSITPKK